MKTGTGSTPVALQLLFRLINKGGEGCAVCDCDFGEHFAVEVDSGFLETVHEPRIVDVVEAAGRRNTGDPDSAEVALFMFSADIRIGQRFHDCLIGNSIICALAAPVAFREL